MRGSGSIYKRGRIWWISYYRNGRQYRESSGTDNKTDAARLLRKRLGEISEGKIPGIQYERTTFDELTEDLIRDYKRNGRRSLPRLMRSIKQLSHMFGGIRATTITPALINKYIEDRLEAGASNATVNRELSALKRMFHLGQMSDKLYRVPSFALLKENNVRSGFFEQEELERLLPELPIYLRPVVLFAYYTGWRKGEILNLKWDQVDLEEKTVRLEPGTTKSGEGRTIYLEGELLQILKELRSKRRLDCDHVFLGTKGKPVRSLRTAWDNACSRAGLKGRIFHDLRRTAVRNMVRAGIPERVAMMISGHKTRSVFDRYNIVSPSDLKKAAQLISDSARPERASRKKQDKVVNLSR